MRNVLLFLTFTLLTACNTTKVVQEVDMSKYPKAFQQILEKHGGLAQWKKMRAMSYTTVDVDDEEKTWIDLWNRRERIEGSNFTMAYNGTEYWLDAKADYTGNPKFMTNLMFYFYAMPFVLADDGVIYSDAPDLVFEGKSYPGIRISYQSDIGISPEDEYFLHYDPKTMQMVWLGYTVTYFSQKKSEKIKWIRYDDWGIKEKLLLPNSLSWYKLEEDKPTTRRNTLQFREVQLSPKAHKDAVFEKTANAKIVE